MADDAILERLRRPWTDVGSRAIREMWKRHSVAEDARDIPGLMATLTEDCVYEMMQTGERWVGHEGATAFYRSLLGAFPDIHFELTDILIGPQGVFEMATATGTHRDVWLGVPPSGLPVEFGVAILFPWDASAGLFTGEKMWHQVIGGPPTGWGNPQTRT